MKKIFLIASSCILFSTILVAQAVGINNNAPHASSILDVQSTTKGMLAPRMTTAQRTAIATPAAGLFLYDTDTNSYWVFNGTAWINLSAPATPGWLLTGNAGTNPASNFIGTTDNLPLKFRVNNLVAGEITNNNVFFGLRAGENNNGINGNFNTGVGSYSLSQNTSGSYNTALGAYALSKNTTGFDNTASGTGALLFNTTASSNTAIGINALYIQSYNNGGVPWQSNNVAIGSEALYANQPISTSYGISNTAVGTAAMRANTVGYDNTAVGTAALFSNTIGWENTAIGRQALFYNSTGFNNTATGYKALRENTEGNYNTANGYLALSTNTTGAGNTALGYAAGPNTTNLSNTTCIGNGATATANNQMVLGNANVTQFYSYGAYVATTAFAPNMTVLNTGQIVRSTSSRRYKKNIADLEINTSAIYNLRPVSYTSLNGDTKHFGLIAEEVAEAIPQLAEYAKEKDVVKGSTSEKLVPDAVQYPLLSVLLLKEVQKHEKIIDDQNKKIEWLMKELQLIKNTIK